MGPVAGVSRSSSALSSLSVMTYSADGTFLASECSFDRRRFRGYAYHVVHCYGAAGGCFCAEVEEVFLYRARLVFEAEDGVARAGYFAYAVAEHSPVVAFVEVCVYVDKEVPASVFVEMESVVRRFAYDCRRKGAY